ncbi:MAG: histidinol-phosphate transaminase [Candidatus Tectomicrobia bacterium]|uniref:Histidinol-phosphate aminotransferase n=1 Tax=Tectimicrobiota bacterium TaxID=2528274 RepID=A0A932M1Z5_UNCTE|nr:histidinol-phosphate transaminase [Candidatus Tectomicrobia bacterium]
MDTLRRVVREMAGYVPGEQPPVGAFIKLNTNENPYPPSPQVLEALRKEIEKGLNLYPDPLATSLRQTAARVYGVDAENIIVGNGSDDLLTIISRACIDSGDPVAMPTPTYTLYDTLVVLQEGIHHYFPFPPDFSLPAGIKNLGAKLTFLANPNSPSGTAVPVTQVEELARALPGILVVDEAYVDFAEETALPLVARYPNLVVLRTLSKSFSLAGLRIGLGFAHADLIHGFLKVKDSYNVNRLSMVAGCAALEDLPWMLANRDRIVRTRERLCQGLKALGYGVHLSRSNFVLSYRGAERQERVYRSLKERGILVRYFDAPGLENSLRITVGSDPMTDRLLEEMGSIVGGERA